MQQRLHSLIGYSIRATDGDLGKVHDFYFDDINWTIRYMVVDTGNWLADRKVLVSLFALGKPDWESHSFSVNLTCDQVRNSPDVDTHLPVYRQHEEALHKYYQWPLYWSGGYGGTLGLTPYPLLEDPLEIESTEPERQDNPHLRSVCQIIGYNINATDGEIGSVDDFIFDDENWALCYLVVNTGNLLPGKKVLISHRMVGEVSWADASVRLNCSQETVKKSPEFVPSKK